MISDKSPDSVSCSDTSEMWLDLCCKFTAESIGAKSVKLVKAWQNYRQDGGLSPVLCALATILVEDKFAIQSSMARNNYC